MIHSGFEWLPLMPECNGEDDLYYEAGSFSAPGGLNAEVAAAIEGAVGIAVALVSMEQI